MYYNGTKLLSLKDKNGLPPEVIISEGNRTAGKTTYFNRYFLNRYIKYGEQFTLIYRNNDELKACGETFLNDDLKSLYFKEYEMCTDNIANGRIKRLILNDKTCGYAVCVFNSSLVKRTSQLFSSVERIMFDEFQVNDHEYRVDEVKDLFSIHTSIARGKGKQVRFVPVFMIGNAVSVLNPYYSALGLSSMIDTKTRYIRGDGYVFERCFNESAAKAQKESGFNRAFSSSDYAEHAADNKYLEDNYNFIEKMKGNNQYLCTFKVNGNYFSIRYYENYGVMYCNRKVDMNFPVRLVIKVKDMEKGFIQIDRRCPRTIRFRDYFNRGLFRFQDIECKNAGVQFLAY